MTAGPWPAHARRPFAFFTLLFLLSVPFWIMGEAAPQEFMPGLSVAALATLAPLAAAGATIVTTGWKPTPLRG